MTRRIDHIRRKATAGRRILLALLTTIYLVVGFAGNIACALEALEAAGVPDTISTTSNDDSSKKSPIVVEHCYSCAPTTIPAAVQISEPSAHAVARFVSPDEFAIVENRLLDTPPPKSLT